MMLGNCCLGMLSASCGCQWCQADLIGCLWATRLVCSCNCKSNDEIALVKSKEWINLLLRCKVMQIKFKTLMNRHSATQRLLNQIRPNLAGKRINLKFSMLKICMLKILMLPLPNSNRNLAQNTLFVVLSYIFGSAMLRLLCASCG